MTDLLDLTPKSDVVVVEIKHPTTKEPLMNDDGSPMTITVFAQHSKDYKKAQRELINKRLKDAEASGKKELDYDQMEDFTIAIMVAVTKEWNITFSGSKPKLTDKKARQIYEEVFWIRDQIDEAVAKSMDFILA